MKHKILCIEDERDFVDDLVQLIENEGYFAECAYSGIDAIAKIRQSTPDLIICDINMPNMDGFQIAEKVKQDKFLSKIPFIFLSARSQKKDMIYANNIGADGYLTKPVDFDLLFSIIRSKLFNAGNLHYEIDREENEISQNDYIKRKQMLFNELNNVIKNIDNNLEIYNKNELSDSLKALSKVICSIFGDKNYPTKKEHIGELTSLFEIIHNLRTFFAIYEEKGHLIFNQNQNNYMFILLKPIFLHIIKIIIAEMTSTAEFYRSKVFLESSYNTDNAQLNIKIYTDKTVESATFYNTVKLLKTNLALSGHELEFISSENITMLYIYINTV